MPKPKSNAAGFSLVEVIFTMVFMTVIVLGVVKLQTSNLALGHTQSLTLQAQQLALESLEITETLGRSEIAASCPSFPCALFIRLDSVTNEYGFSTAAADKNVGDLFERTIEVGALPADTGYEVTALIEWEDSTGPHRRLNAQGETVNAHAEAKRIIYE